MNTLRRKEKFIHVPFFAHSASASSRTRGGRARCAKPSDRVRIGDHHSGLTTPQSSNLETIMEAEASWGDTPGAFANYSSGSQGSRVQLVSWCANSRHTKAKAPSFSSSTKDDVNVTLVIGAYSNTKFVNEHLPPRFLHLVRHSRFTQAILLIKS
jgi:hypothetical protein